jgi:hypothetical protein
VAGEEAEDEVAVRGEGVQAGRGAGVGAGGGGEAGAQEPGQAVGGGRVGVEGAGGGRDLVAADVLGGLEIGAGPDREAVEAGVVHPDPDREAADGEGGRVGRAVVAELLLGDDQGEAGAELGQQLAGPGVGAEQQAAGPVGDVGRGHLDRAAEVADGRHRGAVAQGGAVAGGKALHEPGAAGGRDHAGVGLPEPAHAVVQPEGRPAAHHLVGVQPLVGHAAGLQAAPVGAGRDGRPGREQVEAAGGHHQPLLRLPLQLRPGPVGQAGQAHVAGGVVGAADDAGVVVGGAPVVPELELLQPQHPSPRPGQHPGGGAPQRPQPDHHRVVQRPSRSGARRPGRPVAPGRTRHPSSPSRSRT